MSHLKYGAVGSQEGNSEEDEEMEDMDDEAMFRMDEHVAAVLRARRDAQPSNARRRAVTEFRFRALALLDDYIKRCPSSPHLPSLLSPLLKALVQACQPVVPSESGKPASSKQSGNPVMAGRIQVGIFPVSQPPSAQTYHFHLEARPRKSAVPWARGPGFLQLCA